MRVFVVSLLTILAVGLSFWNFFPRERTGPAALQVFSKPGGVPVAIGEKPVGVTPYENKSLTPGEVKLTIGTGAASFATIVKLNKGVFTVINRELAENPFQQAGEVLNLEAGAGLVVISTPEGSQVRVDDKEIGFTPVKLANLKPGVHKVVVSQQNYLSRSVQVQTHANHRLILDVALASTPESLAKTQRLVQGKPATLAPKVKILSTPTGFLRVRNSPSLGGLEIARVAPDEELVLLEEKPGWFKVSLADGKEGWVSGQYAKKI